jgi:D-glycero-D-manno-heptose 1,7-bisphosphate phosphatase
MSNRFLLVDRDGTLIVEKNYLSDPNEVELIPGAAQALAEARKNGWGIVCISNQAGVGSTNRRS